MLLSTTLQYDYSYPVYKVPKLLVGPPTVKRSIAPITDFEIMTNACLSPTMKATMFFMKVKAGQIEKVRIT